jgi:hypothetical protein
MRMQSPHITESACAAVIRQYTAQSGSQIYSIRPRQMEQNLR